jgi:ATP-dependent helicase/nuclease subunit A
MGEGVRDVLQSFLTLCTRYGEEEAPSLQEFLAWMRLQTSDVKREMDAHSNGVRIMTVHGAKGLEAPVVILPDTMHRVSLAKENILRVDYQGQQMMLYLKGDKTQMRGVFQAACEAKKEALQRESLRLLYVALTRACDELHVLGYRKSPLTYDEKKPRETTWYERVERGLLRLPSVEQTHGTRAYVRHDAPVVAEVAATPVSFARPSLQPYLGVLPQSEPFLRPSALLIPATERQQESTEVYREHGMEAARWGTLLHRCLQHQTNRPWSAFLAELPVLLRALDATLTSAQTQSVMDALHAVTASSEFVALLETPALSEVPVMGRLRDGTGVVGSIDRLILAENMVHVLDFKTGAVSLSGEAQLRAYADVVAPLYPNHRVQLSLVFITPPMPKIVSVSYP